MFRREKMSDEKVEFLYNSIEDIRDTIRAIDVKLSFFLAVILAPLAAAPDILETIINLKNEYIFMSLIGLTIFFWIITISLIFSTLSSIGNPASKVFIDERTLEKSIQPKGYFYSANLYFAKFNWRNSIFRDPKIKSAIKLEAHTNQIKKLPSVVDELIFEQVKLCYIRDLKSFRQRYVISLVQLCGTLAFITTVYFIYYTK